MYFTGYYNIIYSHISLPAASQGRKLHNSLYVFPTNTICFPILQVTTPHSFQSRISETGSY